MALGVGQATVFQDLKKNIKNFGVGFFQLVKKNQRVRMAADGVGQLAALFVADVARRGAD